MLLEFQGIPEELQMQRESDDTSSSKKSDPTTLLFETFDNGDSNIDVVI